ncbi:MAG TPA: hypothetical protein VJ508_06090, partial [Saprospiraceae bacterium]|nr:hypothetical protein [Saprospiraceae bacterium]
FHSLYLVLQCFSMLSATGRTIESRLHRQTNVVQESATMKIVDRKQQRVEGHGSFFGRVPLGRRVGQRLELRISLSLFPWQGKKHWHLAFILFMGVSIHTHQIAFLKL